MPSGSPQQDIHEASDPDAWKTGYDAQLLAWKEENNIAREKAEKLRAGWEKVREEERKQREREGKKEVKEEWEEEKRLERRKLAGKVEAELGLEGTTLALARKGVEAEREGEEEKRWKAVQKAWAGVDGQQGQADLGKLADSRIEKINGVNVEVRIARPKSDCDRDRR